MRFGNDQLPLVAFNSERTKNVEKVRSTEDLANRERTINSLMPLLNSTGDLPGLNSDADLAVADPDPFGTGVNGSGLALDLDQPRIAARE